MNRNRNPNRMTTMIQMIAEFPGRVRKSTALPGVVATHLSWVPTSAVPRRSHDGGNRDRWPDPGTDPPGNLPELSPPGIKTRMTRSHVIGAHACPNRGG